MENLIDSEGGKNQRKNDKYKSLANFNHQSLVSANDKQLEKEPKLQISYVQQELQKKLKGKLQQYPAKEWFRRQA
jgi:hypothetical protein